MSELKDQIMLNKDMSWVPCYLKSETDNVIAEKDAEIERLEILCATYRHDCDNLAISNEQAKRAARTLLKKMNYNKYKRCLAMAEMCRTNAVLADLLSPKRTSRKFICWKNRYEKFLELADKFKEAK